VASLLLIAGSLLAAAPVAADTIGCTTDDLGNSDCATVSTLIEFETVGGDPIETTVEIVADALADQTFATLIYGSFEEIDCGDGNLGEHSLFAFFSGPAELDLGSKLDTASGTATVVGQETEFNSCTNEFRESDFFSYEVELDLTGVGRLTIEKQKITIRSHGSKYTSSTIGQSRSASGTVTIDGTAHDTIDAVMSHSVTTVKAST